MAKVLHILKSEPDETIALSLSDPTNATLGTLDAATLTILDDDEQSYTICLPLVLRNASSPSSLSAFDDATNLHGAGDDMSMGTWRIPRFARSDGVGGR